MEAAKEQVVPSTEEPGEDEEEEDEDEAYYQDRVFQRKECDIVLEEDGEEVGWREWCVVLWSEWCKVDPYRRLPRVTMVSRRRRVRKMRMRRTTRTESSRGRRVILPWKMTRYCLYSCIKTSKNICILYESLLKYMYFVRKPNICIFSVI